MRSMRTVHAASVLADGLEWVRLGPSVAAPVGPLFARKETSHTAAARSQECQERKLDGVDRMACLGPLSLRSRLQEVI